MTGNNMDNFTDDASPKAGVPTGSGAVEVDPRDPDYSREGRQGRGTFFCYHNCYRCKDGQLPCFTKLGVCEYPHARND